MIDKDILKSLPDEVLDQLSSDYTTRERESPLKYILKALRKNRRIMNVDEIIVAMYVNFEYKMTRPHAHEALRLLVERGQICKSQFDNLYWYPTVDVTEFLDVLRKGE